MRPILILTIGLLLISVVFVGETHAGPTFSTSQIIIGVSYYRWMFMTAWNLSSGALYQSNTGYNGPSVFNHPAPQQQWIARFIYDQTTGQTRELAWYYSQDHVQ
ncbi:MAG TPA: hypothetical protein PLE77_14095 [Kiritimatiellia bacterium]|nr:hypothetical protein [Kiritimatiellia bacterium]